MTENDKKKSKRKHNLGIPGFGSVYQRKGDGRFVATFKVEESKQRKSLYAKTEKEAFALLQKAWHEHQQGILATGPQQTIKQYMEHWLEHVHKPRIKVSSYTGYRYSLYAHIIPALGHIKLSKLTTERLESLYAQKRSEGLAERSIRSLHSLIKKALSDAVKRKLIPRNPCEFVSLPPAKQYEARPLNPEEARKLLEAVKGTQLEGIVIMATLTGMREGELIGLKWQDIDFEHGYLTIQRNIVYQAGHGLIESTPKTAKSRRRIMLSQLLMEVLKRHKLRQVQIRQHAGPKWKEHNIVFSTIFGGFRYANNLRTSFYRALKRAGLPRMHFHDLRHSAATILLSLGIHPKVVQELLGHSSISTTMDVYSHVLPTIQMEAIEKISKFFLGSDE